MEIAVKSLLEGAKEAEGTAVIIDVFRVGSTINYLFEKGVSRIFVVRDDEEAFRLKEEKGCFLIGEKDGIKIRGFDLDNSPHDVLNSELGEKEIALKSSNGSEGIVNCKNADEILTASFTNAKATAEYLQEKNPGIVSLVAMGRLKLNEKRDEDEMCAEYIKALLQGEEMDFGEIREHLKKCKSSRRFLDPEIKPWIAEDFHLAMELDRHNFAVRVKRGMPFELEKVEL